MSVVVRVDIQNGNCWEKLPLLLFYDCLSGIARGSLYDVYMADLHQLRVLGIKTREDSQWSNFNRSTLTSDLSQWTNCE